MLGGTVFLSEAVAAEAVRRGHEVVCACRGQSGPVPDGAEHVVLDRDAGDWPSGLIGFDAVIDVSRTLSHVRTAVAVVPDAHWVFDRGALTGHEPARGQYLTVVSSGVPQLLEVRGRALVERIAAELPRKEAAVMRSLLKPRLTDAALRLLGDRAATTEPAATAAAATTAAATTTRATTARAVTAEATASRCRVGSGTGRIATGVRTFRRGSHAARGWAAPARWASAGTTT